MSKKKSIFVTAIVSIMMVFVAIASNRLVYPVFVAIVSAFAALGFLASAIAFCKWLERPSERKEDNLDIIRFKARPNYDEAPVEGYEMTFDEIKREVEAENETEKK